jgi:CHAT domain-containing protein/tetratricopeptide (TPR) repeat protein
MSEIRSRWWIAALLIPALIAVGVAGERLLRRSDVEELRSALRSQPFRPVEARLSVVPDHRPLERTRGADATRLTVLKATALSVLAAASDPRVRATAMLFAGDPRAAVDTLQRIEKPNAATFSDLSAALLTESQASDRLELATDALAATDQALRLEPQNAPASFNRALALERLGLFSAAREEWLRYAQLDPASAWSAEARVRAKAPERETEAAAWKAAEKELRAGNVREVVARFPQLSRVYGEGVYLGEWADGKRESLDLARAIGAELRKLNGESLLADAVAAIDRGAAPAALAEAHRTYRNGRLAYRDQRADEAETQLLAAEEGFRRGGSPMALLARYYRGSVLYDQNRLEEAETLLDQLATGVAAHPGYRALAAQIGWERGACKMATGSLDRAREIFLESRRILSESGERELRAVFDVYLAQVNEYLGEADDAWRHRRPAFETFSETGNEMRLAVALAAAVSARIRREEWSRGAALSGAAIEMAEKLKRADLAAQCWIMSSGAAAGEGRHDAAIRDLQRAERWIREIPNANSRERLEAELGVAEAIALRPQNPEAAVAAAGRAIGYFERTGHRIFLARAYLERARAQRAAGDLAAAMRDVEHGITVVERQRASVRDFEERATFFAATKALFLEGIDLASGSGDVPRAFDLSERGRARAIVDAFSSHGGIGEPMKAAEIQRLLAPGAAVVSYAFLPRRTAIFVVRNFGITENSAPVPTETVRAAVEAWQTAIGRRDEGAITAAQKRLHALLFSPIEKHLLGVQTVVIVSDASLGAIPFGMLDHRFAVLQAPSATVAIRSSLRRVSPQGPPLIVGAFAFDRRAPGAPRQLVSVHSEVDAVARAWPDARRLMGEAADRAAFESLSRDARFIHFAGHAFDRLRSPGDAHLMLSPTRGDGGRLTALDLARLDLRRTELVVLNACRTASPGAKSDGLLNLATAFLVTGVPAVIASSSDVDDAVAAGFAARLHAHLRRGETAEAALQNVIAEETNTAGFGRAAASYGGFIAIGGSKALIRNGGAVR